jgi:hypothetical protein
MKKKLRILALLSLACVAVHGESRNDVPPLTWQEHWFEHKQLLKRVYYDDNVAVYYDDAVDRNITWPARKMEDIWKYVKKTYGSFGKEGRLYVILHSGKYGGGHPATYFDGSHDYRNVIDVGQAGTWTDSTGWNLGATAHEIGHIVEGGSKNVHNSPAFPLWGDSKWMEIFQYDVYKALGWNDAATSLFAEMQTKQDNFPVAGTQWFRNWFYPIYNEHGGTATLNKFFELLAKNFPKNGNAYTRDLNWGEFVHFWSGAAGIDLKAQATLAFGWPDEWDAQFQQARKDFPAITY